MPNPEPVTGRSLPGIPRRLCHSKTLRPVRRSGSAGSASHDDVAKRERHGREVPATAGDSARGAARLRSGCSQNLRGAAKLRSRMGRPAFDEESQTASQSSHARRRNFLTANFTPSTDVSAPFRRARMGFPGLKASMRLSAIATAAQVRGFRAMRASRVFTENTSEPAKLDPLASQ